MDRELPICVWPEWRITEKIGEGSFGKVYKAQRTERGRSFYSAIKILSIPTNRSEWNSVLSEAPDAASARKYFENLVDECIQEINTMENFRGNSYVVSVEDYKVVEYLDEVGWDISIRMEYLTSFMDYCSGKKLSREEVLSLGIDVCRALEYCRKLNIIHRDVKPENIFVSRFGDFKLGDFGIARELERSMSDLSKKGTYSYMAPEMYRGEEYDSSVDIYSLGLVLYKLMNQNRLPFLSLDKQLITYRDKENALNHRMAGEELPPPAEADPDFAGVIKKACAYLPQDRYQSPQELREALETLRRGDSVRVEKERRETVDTELTAALEAALDEEISVTDPKISAGKSKRKKAGKKVQPGSLLMLLIVSIALVTCIISGVYVNIMTRHVNPEQQAEEMVQALEDENYAPSPENGEEFAREILNIQGQATAIVENMNSYQVVGVEGKRFRYYADNGTLMKALIYPELSEDEVYEEYYYWGEELFFAYIWDENGADLYYYVDGSIIRWIDRDGVCHDNENDNEEYVKRGETYWKRSLAQLD